MASVRSVAFPNGLHLFNRAAPISCDDLIIGGGCSGLSLAIELGSRFKNRKIVVLERRKEYVRDHTWSFWRKKTESAFAEKSHRWNGWSVGYQNRQVDRTSDAYQYCSVRADDFYDSCLEKICQLDNVEIILGASLKNSEQTQFGVSCQADLGEDLDLELKARRVFDSRLPSMSPNWLKQTFVGKHVHTASARFDPSRVTLMEFDHAPSCGILFFYVLPYSAHSALVEATVISPSIPSKEFLSSKLDDYLVRTGVTGYEIEYEETGLLPMSADVGKNHQSEPGMISIGLARGLARPSSGYAFDEIQRWTQAFVSRLNEDGDLEKSIPAARPKLITELDRVFLHQIEKDPAGAPSLFMRLFKNTSTDVMPRFLRGQPVASDLLQVIGTLPILPLAKSAAEVWFQQKKSRK